MDLLWGNFNSRMTKCLPDADVEYRKALLALEPMFRKLDQYEPVSKTKCECCNGHVIKMYNMDII